MNLRGRATLKIPSLDQQQSLESSRPEEGEGVGYPVEPKEEDESKPH